MEADFEIRPDTSKSSRVDNFRNTISNFKFSKEDSNERLSEETITMDKYFGSNFSVLKPEKSSYLQEFGPKKCKLIEEDSEEESRKGNIRINESDEDLVSDSNLASTHNMNFMKEQISLKKDSKSKCKNLEKNTRNIEKKPQIETMQGFFVPKDRRKNKDKGVINFSDHIAFRKTSSNLGFVSNLTTKPQNEIQKQTFYGTRGRFLNEYQGSNPRIDSNSRERNIFNALDQASKIVKSKYSTKKSGLESRIRNEEFKLLEKYASRFNLTSDERTQIKRQLKM